MTPRPERLAEDEAALEAAEGLAAGVAISLAQLDDLAKLWGDEGVFRRARDRLRIHLAAFREVVKAGAPS